jgi:hypothetical protein
MMVGYVVLYGCLVAVLGPPTFRWLKDVIEQGSLQTADLIDRLSALHKRNERREWPDVITTGPSEVSPTCQWGKGKK